MSNIKDQLIKLGHINPELRPHISKVLDKMKVSTVFDGRTRKYLVDEMVLHAINDPNAYRTRDARKAVEDAAKDMLANFMKDLRELKQEAIEEVRLRWLEGDNSY